MTTTPESPSSPSAPDSVPGPGKVPMADTAASAGAAGLSGPSASTPPGTLVSGPIVTGEWAVWAVADGPVCDLTLGGRAVSTGAYLAGLIAAGELDTVGTPQKLVRDLFPDEDPVVVQQIWNRALVVGVRLGQLMGSPRFSRDKLARLQGELQDAGFAAMGGLVGRSLSVAVRAPEWHPVDGEDGREH